ncbi:hypothetical protein [Methyloglobulus sp.]|uniref:hypothetical protein n=1 Tax=Methyloglobulus sp. TaxID=2518622 RepID=UPI003988B82E
MQIILTKDFVMDNSHSLSLTDLPIPTGEKFTVVVMRENITDTHQPIRKVYAHRIPVNHIDLPAREELHGR